MLAAGGLAYEIALTRLLSALLVSSWVAPVLAVALLGVGLGAAAAALAPGLRSVAAARTAAGLAAVLAVSSLPAWLWSAGSGRPLLGLLLPLLAYVGLGLASAAILSWRPARAAWLLRADYGAAALTAVTTPWLLGQSGFLGAGVLGAAVVAAALPGLAALVLGPGQRPDAPRAATAPASDRHGNAAAVATATTTAGLAAPLLALLALGVGALSVEPRLHMEAKPIALTLQRGGVVEKTRWDATARTDLVQTPDGARYLYMDGGAGSLVPTPDPNDWSRDVGAFAFAMAPAETAFLIGTGGGLDVAQARAHGVDNVVAVEVNRASVELVRELGAATGYVYQDPTEVIIGDGRRVLAASDEHYDVITLANVVTGAAEVRGAALTENLVYTVEAFEEYLSHLTPDGRLALKLYDELTLTRAMTTALAALVEGGYAEDVTSATDHLLAVLDVSAGRGIPVLVVRRTPFSAGQAVAAARVAEQRGWALLLVPGLLAPPALQALVDGEAGLAELIASSDDIDLSPTHDAAPYFFSFEPGVPGDVRLAGLGAAILLFALLSVAVLAGRAGRYESDGDRRRSSTVRRLSAAVCLGAGFLLVELAALPVIQRTAGHPAWSLSLTLGAVLFGSAVGSQLAARSRSSDPRRPALLATVAVLAWTLLAPRFAAALVTWPPPLAGLTVAATLFAVAVPMGMPFPQLLGSLGRPVTVAGALALSGGASVAAGAGALWLSHLVGTPAVGLTAAGAYLLAAVVVPGSAAAKPVHQPQAQQVDRSPGATASPDASNRA